MENCSNPFGCRGGACAVEALGPRTVIIGNVHILLQYPSSRDH